MAGGTIAALTKIGIISEEMAQPRTMSGVMRAVFSAIAVTYSCFFIYVAFFGPPVEEVFRGTFFISVAVMSLLLFRGRQRSPREGFVWLDELFSFANLVMLCGAFAMLAYWLLGTQEAKWYRFYDGGVLAAAIAGGAVGAGVYLFEAFRIGRTDKFAISDLLFLIGVVISVLWWIENVQMLRERSGAAVPSLLFIYSIMLVAVSFEIARRIIGPLIPLLGLLFFIYSFEDVAQIMPGVLYYPGYDAETVMEFLMASTEGMFGLITNVFATFIVIFVILGAFLEKTGLGAVIINSAYRLTGAKTGGPGLAAVMSSGFFGMISGSGVANVMTTGTFTIPLMKRVGYRPAFAGGVEAAASTGGAYMPPIMGAGAFLLAELTETSYFTIVTIAVIPACLYYISVGLIVYFRALRDQLHGVPADELPQWADILPRLHLLLPIPAMVYFLVIGDSPFLAAAKTIALIVMLKLIDLLDLVPTAISRTSWKVYLPISVAVGVVAYFAGMHIGPPFSWFVDDYVGIGFGDACYWIVFSYILLKLGELIILGPDRSAISDADAPEAAQTVGVHDDTRPIRSLADVFKELIRTIWISLEAGARNTLVVSCIVGVLGILLAAATKSDLPGRVAPLLVEASGGVLPLAIVFVIMAGYIVGMGLPIAASYVVLVIFAVGALADLGVPTLAAHMICYWVAVISAVTPPVALAAFAASSISKSDPVATGNQAFKMASTILIMPFLFVYTPLLLDGSTVDIAVTVAACLVGVVAWAIFLEGYGGEAGGRPVRILAGLVAACLLLPTGPIVALLAGAEGTFVGEAYAVGAVLTVGLIILAWRGRRRPRHAGAA